MPDCNLLDELKQQGDRQALARDLYGQLADALTVAELVGRLGSILELHELHYGHGTDNPRDEAYALVFSALRLDFTGADRIWDNPVSRTDIRPVIDLAARRISKRMPLPYLTGEAWFAGLEFRIDERALIPRSPLAELIERGFAPWIDTRRGLQILDMCAGNGCIGIAAAVYLSHATVDIVDISKDALELAGQNIELHGVRDRVMAIHSNLFENLDGKCYDLIISNPPYVPAGSMANLPIEYRYEPEIALQAGDEGMAIVDALLLQSAGYLNDDGILIVEVGEIEQAVHRRYSRLPFIWLEFERGGEGVFLLHKRDLQGSSNGKS